MLRDDSFEDNDDSSTAAAVTPGSYGPLIVCDADPDDYFAINVPAGHTLHARLTFSHSGGDIDLALLDSNGTEIASSATDSHGEATEMTVAKSGTYYVLAVYQSSSGSNNCDMRLTLSCEDCLSYQGELRDGSAPANGN